MVLYAAGVQAAVAVAEAISEPAVPVAVRGPVVQAAVAVAEVLTC